MAAKLSESTVAGGMQPAMAATVKSCGRDTVLPCPLAFSIHSSLCYLSLLCQALHQLLQNTPVNKKRHALFHILAELRVQRLICSKKHWMFLGVHDLTFCLIYARLCIVLHGPPGSAPHLPKVGRMSHIHIVTDLTLHDDLMQLPKPTVNVNKWNILLYLGRVKYGTW